MNGTIVAVESIRNGAQLAEAVSGATLLTLTNTVDFNEGGGKLSVDDGTGTTRDYVAASHASSTITLSSAATYPAGLMVYPEPKTVETIASVCVDPTDPLVESWEAVRAVIPYTMRAVLPEGVRKAGEGEMVRLETVSGRLQVADVIDQAPPAKLTDVKADVDGVIGDVQKFKDSTIIVTATATGKPPVLTGNTAAGTITWPEFRVDYQGKSGIYPEGSTDYHYVTVNKALGTLMGLHNDAPPVDDWVIFVNNHGVPTDVQNSQFVDGSLVVSGTITASALETDLVLASKIIAGPPDGAHATMDPNGITLYRTNPDGGSPLVSSKLGAPGTDDFLQVFSSTTGKAVASIDQNGGLVAQKASLGIAAGDTYINGQKFEDYITPYPAGVVDYGYRDTNGTETAGSGTEYKWLELQTMLQPGRLYRVQLAPTYVQCKVTANTKYLLVLRQATGGAAVTTGTSWQLQSARGFLPTLDYYTSPSLTAIVNTSGNTAPLEYRFLTSYIAGGPGNVYPVASTALPSFLFVEDMGIAKPQIGISHTGGSVPETRQNYTAYWVATASGSYQGNGTKRTDTPDIVCGPDPTGPNGNGCGMAVFNGGAVNASNPSENGKTLWQALTPSGQPAATINSIEVYAYANHTYSNYGAYVRYIGSTYTIIPNTYTNAAGNYYSQFYLPKAGGKYGPTQKQFISSVTFGQTPESTDYYARLAGASSANPPVLKISYTR